MIAGIDAAQASPLRPVKVNAVLVRGINDDEVEAFAEFARDRDLIMRFIEYMPLDADRAWTRDWVVTGAEVPSAFPRAGRWCPSRTSAAKRRASIASRMAAAKSA